MSAPWSFCIGLDLGRASARASTSTAGPTPGEARKSKWVVEGGCIRTLTCTTVGLCMGNMGQGVISGFLSAGFIHISTMAVLLVGLSGFRPSYVTVIQSGAGGVQHLLVFCFFPRAVGILMDFLSPRSCSVIFPEGCVCATLLGLITVTVSCSFLGRPILVVNRPVCLLFTLFFSPSASCDWRRVCISFP